MKYAFLSLLITICTLPVSAQGGLDQSPLDAVYFPSNSLKDKEVTPILRVLYGRPQKKDRQIFGDLVAYDQVWRTGANECTEIKLFQDITIDGKTLEAGRYSLFTIPGQEEWTIIFNAETDMWGHYSYNVSKDVLRVKFPSAKTPRTIEALTIFAQSRDGNNQLVIAWEDTMVKVPFSY